MECGQVRRDRSDTMREVPVPQHVVRAKIIFPVGFVNLRSRLPDDADGACRAGWIFLPGHEPGRPTQLRINGG
jgi:hypothetical protein